MTAAGARRSGWVARGARRGAVLVALALIGLVAGPLSAPAFAADGTLVLDVTITDTNGAPLSTVDASVTAAYRVNIAYGCNGADCTGTKVVVAPTLLDPYLGTQRKESAATYIPPFSPAPTLTGSINAGYTVALGTVGAGTNGVIRFDYTVNAQGGISRGNFFPDGSPITPSVTVSASNATAVTDTAAATWKSYLPTPALSVIAGTPRINTDQNLTVRASDTSGCWRLYNGVLRSWPWYLCADSGRLTLDLPAKAVYVSSTGNGVYDAASHSVTFTNGPRVYRGQEDAAVTVRFPGSAYPTSGDGCVVPETFTAHDASLTYLDGTTKASNPARASATVTVGNCAPFAKAALGKSSYIAGAAYTSTTWNIPATAADAYNVFWNVVASNQANVPGVATIVDDDLNQADLPVTSITVPAGGPADIAYTLDNGTTGSATDVTSLNAPAGRRFAKAVVTSATLAGPNVKTTDTGATPFTVRFIATLRVGRHPRDPHQHRHRDDDLSRRPLARHHHARPAAPPRGRSRSSTPRPRSPSAPATWVPP